MVSDNPDKNTPRPGEDDAVPAGSRRTCIRCGTCCQKGGPSLHIEDRALVEDGLIAARYLFTIREGEPAYDNIRECIQPAGSDIIKIKSDKKSQACIFFKPKLTECRIYAHRPVECRALKCWDIKDILNIYDKNRLARKDLFEQVEGLWDLVQDHQRRCSYSDIEALAKSVLADPNQEKNAQKLLDMIKYDASMRPLIIERGGMSPDMLDFLFGRPLTETIKMFGLNVTQKNGRLQIGRR